MTAFSTSCKAVCFDLFNTLVSVGQVPEHVGRYTADILGLKRNEWNEACFSPQHEICRPTSHVDNIRILAHTLDPTIPLSLIEQAALERQQRFDYALINIPEQILDGLRQLRSRGLKLALISNASSSEVLAWEKSPLAELFDEAIFSWSAGLKKPDNRIYQHTARSLALSAEECLFVGDGGSDEHFGAHAAGMKPILITHFMGQTEQEMKEIKYADVLVATASDLQELSVCLNEI